jgi:hypothetical protein
MHTYTCLFISVEFILRNVSYISVHKMLDTLLFITLVMLHLEFLITIEIKGFIKDIYSILGFYPIV